MRYEDLLASPQDSAARFGAFLAPAAVDAGWLARATALVGRGRSSWQMLPEAERRELDEACAPGFAALAEIGLRWPDD
jgi:putative sulfotransferase